MVQPEEAAGRQQEGAGDLRRGRVHGVHPVPDADLQRRSESALRRRWPRKCQPRSRGHGRRSCCQIEDEARGARRSISPCASTRGRSISSTASRSPAIRPRATTSFDGRCGSSKAAIFNTEALKYSVRRLNQLGYFKELKGDDRDMKVDKTPDKENNVDVTLKFEEQNRNQLTFGAGVSQYEGFFGQLGFQTSNFLGRGESLTLSLQAGDRAQNYQLAFTEPFLFDRNITGGFDIYNRSLQYIGYYTQKSRGLNLVFGFPVADFTRMFMNYSFEKVRMTDLNEALFDTSCILRPDRMLRRFRRSSDLSQLTPTQIEVLRRNPFVYDSLLIGQGGERSVSKVTPSLVHNTVDNPIFPNTGQAAHGVDRSGRARRQHAVLQAARRGDLLLPASAADVGRVPRAGRVHLAGRTRLSSCRSSSGCSWAASTASAASTSGPSGRACRDRSSCSAATRACCSTPST